MHLDEQLESLVRAGWNVIESDFDAIALTTWRREASACINVLTGSAPTHSPDSRTCASQGRAVATGSDRPLV